MESQGNCSPSFVDSAKAHEYFWSRLATAQSDALRVRGDAANPARQESRPARRSAARNRLRCPTPDNRRRDDLARGWFGRAIAATGGIQHGKPKYRPLHGITGKGACMGEYSVRVEIQAR